ncbi:MAG: hypothetical protein Q9O62_06990 [Ardenticatenia bacterium]|nr:hypothetical protein [Ardenticatenia bacterium]
MTQARSALRQALQAAQAIEWERPRAEALAAVAEALAQVTRGGDWKSPAGRRRRSGGPRSGGGRRCG